MDDIKARVRDVMESNRRVTDGYQYTIPSPDIYPFQWLWDSCFHAIILSKFDLTSAKEELRSACSRPLPFGLIPHIIYWEQQRSEEGWGREMRGDVIDAAWGVDGTSAITQPPLMAYALWRVYECDKDTAFLRELYPVLRTHYAYLLRERTPGNDSLVYIINPDESGEDNSPRFDRAQDLPLHHSAEANLDRRILRMRENATCRFDARSCMHRFFAIADVPFNVIFAEGLGYLAHIADVLEQERDVLYFTEQKRNVEQALREKLHIHDGEFYSYDNIEERHIYVKTWALFMPLFSGLLSQREADHLIENLLLNKNIFWTEWPIPTTAYYEPCFDPNEGFWRGPVWIAPNWFLYHGLKRYGHTVLANELKQKTIDLIAMSGFREQYSPLNGGGYGARNFTWGGLVLDME